MADPASRSSQPLVAKDVPPAPRKGEKPLPLAARVCVAFGWLQVVASILVWYVYGLGGMMETVDEDEVQQFHNAKVMLLPAMLLESCYLISSRNSMCKLQLHGHEMSYLVILEYCVKMLCYSTMAHFNGGLVHKNLRAFGPMRACYTVRYMEWSIAVPTLLSINNYPLLSHKTPMELFRRLRPNLFVTWAYIWASWVAEVTPDATMGWFLVTLSFVAYLAAIWDQVDIILEADADMHGVAFKVVVVVIKEIVFFLYGVVYLLGIANLMSSYAEQTFYTYGDVMLKVVQASVLVVVRNWEDLAELQRALEHKVETGRQDMSRLFKQAKAPIFAISQEGFVKAWNEHLSRLSGVSEAHAIGKSILELVQDESKDGLKLAIESCWSGLSSGAVEVALKCRTEESQRVQMLLTLIVQMGSDVTKTITAIGQDLTELGAMKAMQERKARFTAVLGHELRSPLHGIMGLSGSMADNASNPMQKRQLSMIKGCAARLLDLVTNIMEMAKNEKNEATGGQAIDLRPVNIMDIVDEVIGMTEMAVDKSGQHLVRGNVIMVNNMCVGKLPMVKGDSYKITQLLYNLVTNAAKFTTSGSIQLSAREVEETGMLEIDVADTGKGISPEALKKIFEPFQQEENKDSRSFQGIGLGLSVAMSVAKLHGGDIRVASRNNHGSTFTVVLPCDSERRAALTLRAEDGTGVAKSRAAKHVAALSAKAGPRSGVLPPPGQRPLVLCVDEDEVSHEVIEQTLGSDYRVVRATTGSEAFAYLDSDREYPSLMLLDATTSGLSPFDVVRDLRGKRSLSHTQLPVVMLSSLSPVEPTANEAYSAGATDFMQKPINGSLLKHRLSIIDVVRREIGKAEVAAVEQYRSEVQQASQTESEAPKPPPEEQRQQEQQEQREKQQRELEAQAAETAARREAIERLEKERDAIRKSLEAQEAEGGKAQEEIKRLSEERNRLQAELDAAVVKAARATDSMTKLPLPRHTSSSLTLESLGSATALTAELEFANAETEYYLAELEHREREIAGLRKSADQKGSEAYLQRQRADSLDRELAFVRKLQYRMAEPLPR